MLTAIIVAGGSSRRMGFDKTFAPLSGQPVIAHAIVAFEKTASVRNIVIVGQAERLPEIEQLVRAQKFGKVTAVVSGGARRQDSVLCGLKCCAPLAEFIAVHDAARPLVRPELIERVFASARLHRAAACAAPVTDTLKRAADGFVSAGVDRANLFAVQTPQIFRGDLLLRAYEAVFEKRIEITDEISALEQIGEKTFLVPNESPNFKITYPPDLTLAQLALQAGAGG